MPTNFSGAAYNVTTGGYPVLIQTASATGPGVPLYNGGPQALCANGTNVLACGGGNPVQFSPVGVVPQAALVPFLRGRGMNQGNGSTTDIYGGTSQESFAPTVASQNIVVTYQNYTTTNVFEQDAPNPVTISAAFWDGTTSYPLTFKGQTTAVLGTRGYLQSDPLPYVTAGPVTFQGYIVGTALTVTTVPATGAIAANQVLRGGIQTSMVSGGSKIVSGSGTSWVISPYQTVGSPSAPVTFYADTGYWIRTYAQLAAAPTALAVSGSEAGGSLASGTYYYKVTCFAGAQGESTVLGEGTYTTSSGLGQATVSWVVDQRSVPCQSFNIYRSSAASGAEFFFANAGTPGQNAFGKYAWTDLGSITPASFPQVKITAGTGGVSSTTLTVTATASGTFVPGMYVNCSGITTPPTAVLGTYNGLTGTLTMSVAQTVSASTACTLSAPPPAQQILTIGPTLANTTQVGEEANYAYVRFWERK